VKSGSLPHTQARWPALSKRLLGVVQQWQASPVGALRAAAKMAGAQKQMMIEQAVAAVASQLEHQLDAQLDRLDNMGEQDLEQIRKARVQDMKRKQEKTKEWLAKGHGEYNEVLSEKEFFDAMKCVTDFGKLKTGVHGRRGKNHARVPHCCGPMHRLAWRRLPCGHVSLHSVCGTVLHQPFSQTVWVWRPVGIISCITSH